MIQMQFSSERIECPKCGSSRGYAPYVDGNGGYCHACSSSFFTKEHPLRLGQIPKEPLENNVAQNFVSQALINSFPDFETSTFADYFGSVFGDGFIWHCKNLFDVKADKYGATVFVYRNYLGQITNLKSIPYKADGHRDKGGFKIKMNDRIVSYPAVFGYRSDIRDGADMFNFLTKGKGYHQCLYNEFSANLNYQPFNYDFRIDYTMETPIILVESEKSVLIASYFYPEFIWMATGGISGLTDSKIRMLKNRNVLLSFDNGDNEHEASSKALNILRQNQVNAKEIRLFQDYDVKEGYDVADVIEFLFKNNILTPKCYE